MMRKLLLYAICLMCSTAIYAGYYYTQDEEGNVTRTKGDTPYPEGAIWQTDVNYQTPVDDIKVDDGKIVRRSAEEIKKRLQYEVLFRVDGKLHTELLAKKSLDPLLEYEVILGGKRKYHIELPTEQTGTTTDPETGEELPIMSDVPINYCNLVDGELVAMTEAERTARDEYDAQVAEAARLASPVPDVTPLQFRLILLSQGITEAQIDALLETIEDPTEKAVAKLTWSKASVFKRDHPMIASMGATMGFTALQMDELFRAAAEIE